MKTQIKIKLITILLVLFCAGCASAPNRWNARSLENQIDWDMQEDYDDLRHSY